MPHIPKIVCEQCEVAMTVLKNGVVAQADADGMPYYKVRGDRFECPICKRTVLSGFAFHPQVEHYDQPLFDQVEASVRFDLQPPKVAKEQVA